jgi:hypothetical protein
MFSMIRRKETEMARETASQPVDTKSPVMTPTIWRIAFWGCGALIALAAVTLAAVSESGAQRLGLALNAVTGLPERQQTVVAQIPANPPEPSADTIKLAENLRLLTADRDRLNARVASLEHALEDVIGSIKRQAAATEQASRLPPLAAAPAAPAISAPATVTAATPPADDLPRPLSYVPLPPERLATIEAAAARDAVAPPPKPEIGIDLGGASSPEALRAYWASVKANHGPLLTHLRPMMTMRERKQGTPSYRLILGPLPTASSAGHLCTQLVPAHIFCRPTTFISQTAALL